jgi:hypothetical protein
MKNYVGRKCKGFRFEDGIDGIDGVRWGSDMHHHIGEIGEITKQEDDSVRIQFQNDFWYYPISLIEPHLIPEIPEIPQLGEGVDMEVSNTGIEWFIRRVIAKRHDRLFISHYGDFWKYARPIQEVKKSRKRSWLRFSDMILRW